MSAYSHFLVRMTILDYAKWSPVMFALALAGAHSQDRADYMGCALSGSRGVVWC